MLPYLALLWFSWRIVRSRKLINCPGQFPNRISINNFAIWNYFMFSRLWKGIVNGMPEVRPSFIDVLGSFGRQLFHGMPEVIPQACKFHRPGIPKTFPGSPAPILLLNLCLENSFLWFREHLPISRIFSVQELPELGNSTGSGFQTYFQNPWRQFCY